MTPLEQKWYRHLWFRREALRHQYPRAYRDDSRAYAETQRAIKALTWRIAEMAAPRTARERLKAEINALSLKQIGVYWDYQTLTEKSAPSRRLAAIIARQADAMAAHERQIALLKRTLAALEAEQ